MHVYIIPNISLDPVTIDEVIALYQDPEVQVDAGTQALVYNTQRQTWDDETVYDIVTGHVTDNDGADMLNARVLEALKAAKDKAKGDDVDGFVLLTELAAQFGIIGNASAPRGSRTNPTTPAAPTASETTVAMDPEAKALLESALAASRQSNRTIEQIGGNVQKLTGAIAQMLEAQSPPATTPTPEPEVTGELPSIADVEIDDSGDPDPATPRDLLDGLDEAVAARRGGVSSAIQPNPAPEPIAAPPVETPTPAPQPVDVAQAQPPQVTPPTADTNEGKPPHRIRKAASLVADSGRRARAKAAELVDAGSDD